MATALDRVTEEYGTYAPKGSTCLVCKQEIKRSERVRRGYLRPEGEGSNDMTAVYHHSPKCPA
ncbi:hypothetical protein [Streptomyces regalis]|uniref:PARP-type domain-containing protein n=1 Tax=Streptomyces regalis TaxID=68262 RepID=A0A101JQU2_9ACTN|nr:hypothetical protein [Streptomyces regalis]KUL31335.1 hypothetical protein ADL12_25305 [Streptomyces regalis]